MSISMVLPVGLSSEERAKFNRLEHRIANVLEMTHRYVRVCEARGSGNERTIVLGACGRSENLIGVPYAIFVSGADDAVIAELQRQVSENA
jgi:hypothetical protein